jgi:hypothetical protein
MFEQKHKYPTLKN